MRTRLESPAIHLLVTLSLLSACGEAANERQPTTSDRRLVAEHRMTPEQVRQMTGVDRLPQVVDQSAFRTRINRAYPAELRAQRVAGSALVDVLVDEAGRVASATPVNRPAGMRAVLILEEEDGSQRHITPKDHPAFQAAAVSALRDIAFSPAMRDGQPVPFTLRMTVTFDPPAGGEK
jgi:outer membrane biosynthesis protein TonB